MMKMGIKEESSVSRNAKHAQALQVYLFEGTQQSKIKVHTRKWEGSEAYRLELYLALPNFCWVCLLYKTIIACLLMSSLTLRYI
ncbi:hypothetical protein L1987_42412 [Smallanthus sonchifolius]|uniref:Uncharacterized protein n=1 Tax=Smallanthus sonchifolius TaxID=185202 RepID=A0ACB9GIS9_9ASTR|nr:hypothetical protein L1987_42412 [Smallanthus sonchifolius]